MRNSCIVESWKGLSEIFYEGVEFTNSPLPLIFPPISNDFGKVRCDGFQDDDLGVGKIFPFGFKSGLDNVAVN